jgi:D-alanyl-D-alanine dipeptidase
MNRIVIILLLLAGHFGNVFAQKLPQGFVYMEDIESTIQQDMRYATDHNFVGRSIDGYHKAECILSKPAALALAQVQQQLKMNNLSLKVYDCYRPRMAVDDFIRWSQVPVQQHMKAEFYPRIDKKHLFKLGYIAVYSGHSRGSTVDLTLVPMFGKQQQKYYPGQKLVACYAPYKLRYPDNSIDMGSGYDCLDEAANVFNPNIPQLSRDNRMLLRNIMIKYGFEPYDKEWWHFTLKNEPYKNQYFNFPVE